MSAIEPLSHPLLTARMRLVPTSARLVGAEIGDRTAFARILGAQVPPDWPPDEAADALPWFLERLELAGDAGLGWYGFYGIVVAGEADASVLVGGGGSLGPPADGRIEVGYSVLPAYQRRGYATEMMAAIVDRLVAEDGVRAVDAETAEDNVASRALLVRLGFDATGPGREPGTMRYARSVPRAT